MDYEQEIRSLKASLFEHKLAMVGLAVCIAQTLDASDPKFRSSLTTTLRAWLGRLQFRQQKDAEEVALMFGQAFVEPSFPMSPIPPNEEE
jgi:hypothetical protein